MTRTCGHETAAGACGSTDDVRRFLTGWRCTSHTPAAVAGRARAADPATHVYPDALARRGHAYGEATTDPLGRTGGTVKHGLPKRIEGDPGPDDAPWLREEPPR